MEPLDLLALLTSALDELGLKYLVTGSMAAMTYGETRFTNDIDVVIDLRAEDVDRFCARFPSSEFYLSPESVRAAVLQRRAFNIIHPASGLKVDVFVPKDDAFERSRRARGVRLPISESREVMFASPEDVIIKKLQYYQEGGSEKHLRDIASLLKIQAARIDRAYVADWSETLGVKEIWDAIIGQTS